MLGLVRPEQGAVRVLGVDPAGSRGAAARRALGFLPENVAFHGAMTGHELMGFYARLKGAAPARNAELLERAGILDAAHRRVATYSKGMRQRLGIAQALIGEPRLLVFDEPTSGLDPASRAQVYETIDRLRAEGATVLISTHALAEIEDRVDRAAIMHKGRLLAAGTLGDLRKGLRADLRIRLEVVPCSTRQVLAALPAPARCIESTDRTLALQVPPAAKMETLRAIAACGARIVDVEVHAPGLQELYAELVSASGERP
jgi:Cu-processing system ATP-binding protein